MTDLTPELEKWAGDEEWAKRWEKVIADALRYHDSMPGYYNEYLLHAHAKMLQQQATIERLTALIDEHNAKCADTLNFQWMIDTQDGVK